MPTLNGVPWPPAPMRTDRLMLRATRATDRPGYVELYSNDEVGRFVGGARPREQLERDMPPVPGSRPGVFAVERAGRFIGFVSLDHREAASSGDVRVRRSELEVGYMLLPEWWGMGYATEAVSAVLEWADRYVPSVPILLCTQSAHHASVRLAQRLGFHERERFMAFGAEQWLGVRGGGRG